MFVLSVFKDSVRILPNDFRKTKSSALIDEINLKYANKVVQDVGLCICVHDMLEASDGIVHHGDGSVHVKVKFRMIVFRPFIGEVLVGYIRSMNESHIRASLGFFDDISIPAVLLQEDSYFNTSTQCWNWKIEGGDLEMQVADHIRFRVMEELFVDASPPRVKLGPDGTNDTSACTPTEPPYQLTCSANEPGLGLAAWWQPQEEEADVEPE